jgi:hypothetical protein
MTTYKIVRYDNYAETIEAEYFKMTSDGFGGLDAYFYVTEAHAEVPNVISERLIGFIHRPKVVVEYKGLDRTAQDWLESQP